MKKRLVLIAGVCLAASCLPAHAQKAKGEDALPFIAATPLPPEAAAAQADAARALLKRVLPKDAAKFQMEVIPAEIETIEVPREKPRPTAPVAGTTAGTAAGTTVPVRPKPPVLLPPLTFDVPHDVFEIQTQNGVTVLRGNNGVALASALNYFLKYYGGSMLTWDGFDQINLPTPLPPVTPKVHAASPHQLRLAYQTATFGYATAYWQWDKWEREIDFLALSGINRALLPIGQEAVWMATWKQFGYSDDDIRKWLVAPGHAPWQTMGNMENTGPALPQSVIDARLKLAQKIAARMRELGIEPVLPGYIGIVPPDFKKHSADAVIVGQGQWVPGVKRPDVLDQSTPLYTDIAAKYYAAQKELLGTSSAYAADPFNDKGKKGDINDGDAGKAIYAAIDAASPGALWVLMGTLDQPAGGLTFGVPKNKTLILDLAADRTELWKDRKGFDKVPWLWCAYGPRCRSHARRDTCGRPSLPL